MQGRANVADAYRREFDQRRRDLRNPGRTQYGQNQACDHRKNPIGAPHALPVVHLLAQFQHKVFGRQTLIMLGE
jgi:hypothetical protein